MNSPSGAKTGNQARPIRAVTGWFTRLALRTIARKAQPPSRRLLFLDDDPRRAEIFLAEHPQAVWVENVTDCLSQLENAWDEIHLDHDLGGKQLVSVDSIDCGMEVIRWMCKEPRDHLRSSRFFVHTHNLVAGLLMVMQMQSAGFNAEFRPFGHDLSKILAHNEPENGHAEKEAASKLSPRRWLSWVKRWWPRSKGPRSSSSSTSTSILP
jgi:Cyclic-phosphate processing Receiver domain